MTDQFTSLSLAALRDIISNIDQSLAVFARHPDPLRATELQVKRMLVILRAQVVEQLQNHPDLEK